MFGLLGYSNRNAPRLFHKSTLPECDSLDRLCDTAPWGMRTVPLLRRPNAYHQDQVADKLSPARPAARLAQTWRSTIIFLIDWIALAGFRPLGHVFAQFMIV